MSRERLRAFASRVKPMVAIVFIVALAVRVTVVTHSAMWLHDDGQGYDQIAQSIVRGEGFARNGRPTAVEDPLYPGFLALVYAAAGHEYRAVQVAQSLLGAAGCVAVALIGWMVAGSAVGWMSGLAAAVYPSLIKLSGHLLSETLFIPLLLAALAAWMWWQRTLRLRWAVAAGVVFGLAALTRFGVGALPVVLAVLAWRSSRRFAAPARAAARRQALAMLVAMGLTIVPWTARNWIALHEFIPISTKIGLDLYASYFPPEGKRYGLTPVDATMSEARTLYTADENHASAFLVARTFEFITRHPGEALSQLALKVLFFITPFDWEILGYRVYNLGYSLMIPWALFGLYAARRRRLIVGSLVATLAYYGVLTLLTYGSPRLRLPLEPILLVFASIAWLAFAQAVRRWPVRAAAAAGWCLVNVAVWWNAEAVHQVVKRLATRTGLW